MPVFTGSPFATLTYDDQVTAPVRKALALFSEGVVRVASMEAIYTHAAAQGAGTGELNLFQLPAGKIRVFPDQSWVVTSQYALNADLHIGFRSYTEPEGTVVAEDDNAFLDNADVGGAALDQALTLPATGFLDINSRNPVTIYAMIDTGNIETGDTLWVYMAYTRIG